MLEILKSRYRLKLDKNLMRVLDACYCYYEPMFGKKITEDDTIQTLMSPATMLTEYQVNDALLSAYKLSDYKNSALREIDLSDTEADELIYMLKSKYDIIAYNSNHNMLDKSCKNFPWKLEFSEHYAKDSGEIKQFNETDDYIEVVRDDHNNMNFRHVTYPKYDPVQNNVESVIAVNNFDIDRISDGIYKKYTTAAGDISIYVVGLITISDNIHNGLFSFFHADDDIRASLLNDTASVYVCRNSLVLYDLYKTKFAIWNIPYDTGTIHNFNQVVSNGNSVEFVEILTHAARTPWMQTFHKLDTPSLAKAWTNGHRTFTDKEIFMARNELSRVVPSSHYDHYTFTGEECESPVYEKGIEFASMPDGTFVMNTCTGISEKCAKVDDRYYTIIRNVNEGQNYLAWSDDKSMWISIIKLPDCIDKIECELCDNFYIVMRDTGSYLWAYSLDLGFMTIS